MSPMYLEVEAER